MASCVFCDKEKSAGRIFYESNNFFAMPTIGQISHGGHSLIVPKYHAPCLGEMSSGLFMEFDQVKLEVQNAIEQEYGKSISFEHGIIGQSVPHAHLQILPSNTDMFSTLHQKYPFYKKLDSMEELREIYEKRRVYLYYENQQHEKFVFFMDAIPQYLRLVAAQEMGRTPRGDWKAWRNDPDCAKIDDLLMDQTVQRLGRLLKK
ncbi:MAG TPA: HIT domain-containing protein [Candidatus Nanoarchaeia archaeon]|nr:HIT domain-containing protein [Candidatus Nanoarchaeia archaeon]